MKTINDLSFDVPKEIDNYTHHSAEIALMISNYIRSIEGMNKKSFAKLLGKTASDITRWISGSHNFTILTLSLIESRTGMEIIKKLSDNNVKTYLDGGIFKLESEEILKTEINKLKREVSELEEKLNSLNSILCKNRRVWSIAGMQGAVNTHGVYREVMGGHTHSIILDMSDINIMKYDDNEDIHKIRSRGNGLPVTVKM